MSGYICSLLLSAILVIGQIVKDSSTRYEIPKYWARIWLVISCLLVHSASKGLYAIIMHNEEEMGNTCSLLRLASVFSIASNVSIVVLCCHIWLSVYDPYILSGRMQHIVWISLLGVIWIIGTTVVILLMEPFIINIHEQLESDELEELKETTTSAFKRLDKTTSYLEALESIDIEWTFNVTMASITNWTSPNYKGNVRCILKMNPLYGQSIRLVPDVLLFVCAVLSLPGLHTRLNRKITRIFKRFHSPLSESQVHVEKWINQQIILSVAFIQLHLIYECIHIPCWFGYYPYCDYLYTVLDGYFLLVFCMSCFLLKDVRTSFMNIFYWCKRHCRHGAADGSAPDQVAVDLY